MGLEVPTTRPRHGNTRCFRNDPPILSRSFRSLDVPDVRRSFKPRLAYRGRTGRSHLVRKDEDGTKPLNEADREAFWTDDRMSFRVESLFPRDGRGGASISAFSNLRKVLDAPATVDWKRKSRTIDVCRTSQTRDGKGLHPRRKCHACPRMILKKSSSFRSQTFDARSPFAVCCLFRPSYLSLMERETMRMTCFGLSLVRCILPRRNGEDAMRCSLSP